MSLFIECRNIDRQTFPNQNDFKAQYFSLDVFAEKVMNQRADCLFIFVFIFTVPPNIVDETSSGDTLATEGRAVTLHCDATGTPR